MVYEFTLNTQFVGSKEIAYDEICMCKDIIDIFEKNRNFVLRRLKKYIVEDMSKNNLNLKKNKKTL